MDYEEHIAAIERETTAMVEAFRASPRDARVPTCPEWTIADLAKHVGEFTGLWTHVVCEGTSRSKTPYSEMPADGDLGSWYEPLAGCLVNELRATTANQRVWSWIPDQQHAAMVARRCANELAVHRFDAQSASGTQSEIDGALAADALEEIFVMNSVRDEAHEGSGRSLHVHSTDRGDEWTITLSRQGPEVQREHTPADLTISGAMSDLILLMYQRPTLGPVQRDGDGAVLDGWYKEFTFD